MTRHLITALIVVLSLTGCSSSDDPSPQPSQPTTATETASTDEGAAFDEPSTVETADYHDTPLSEQQMQLVVDTASQFLHGWSTADAQQRDTLIKPVASADLYATATDPRFTALDGQPSGPVHVIEASQLLAMTRHRLDDGTQVQLTLAVDPDAQFEWIVISIEQV